ncbi:hypothetical protein [Streptomyces sp. NPDC056255]|uniref:hypothetical protein n=1 Tax=Streptomyces sp. NPDC056255 TaxID=3345764 RepID=UPI0035DA023F
MRIPRVKAQEFHKGQLRPYGSSGFTNDSHSIQLAPQPEKFASRTAQIIVSWKIREDDPTDLGEHWGAPPTSPSK